MLNLLVYFAIGMYFGVGVVVTIVLGIIVSFVGDKKDWWRPFFYGLFWPYGIFVLLNRPRYFH